MTHRISALLLAASLLVAPAASAQYATMDRSSDEKMAGVQLDFVIPDKGNGFFLRTDLYLQATFGGAGAYLEFPFSTALPDGKDNTTAMGNLEIGGVYNMGFSMLGLALRVGLVLPTASKDDLGKALTNAAANIGRLTDLIQGAPSVFGLRLALSPRFDALGFLFARADLGVDIYFATGDNPNDTLTFFRGNIAVGAGVGIFKAALELVNYGNVGSGSPDGIASKFAHTFAVTLTFSPPIIHPYLAFVTPLDDGARGEVYVISAGIKAALPF